MGDNGGKEGTISIIWCAKCGAMHHKIRVMEDIVMPYCPVCHIEIKRYFMDEEMRFIHFGEWDTFAEIMETLQSNCERYDVDTRRGLKKPDDNKLTIDEYANKMRDRANKQTVVKAIWKPLERKGGR